VKKYRCPYCGHVIKEVNVFDFTWRRLLASAGLGLGLGMVVYPLVPSSKLVGAIGAFIVGFIVVFLISKEKFEK